MDISITEIVIKEKAPDGMDKLSSQMHKNIGNRQFSIVHSVKFIETVIKLNRPNIKNQKGKFSIGAYLWKICKMVSRE